jgi:hypothetical protein
MQFTIITKPLSWFQKIKFDFKKIVKKILNKNTFWPTYVLESIFEWLKELQKENKELKYNINPKEKDIYQIVFVPNWVEALKYAVDLKEKWKINKIIAWPNISVPRDKNDIIFDKNIDIILVPSDWVKNYFLTLNQYEKRIQIWYSWNKDVNISKNTTNKLLLYKKNCPVELYEKVKIILKSNLIDFDEIVYGKYKKNEYLEKLNNSIWMIYLQESESQWFSLQEAWTKNIPTLVWNRWYWEYKWIKHFDEKISAPYMDNNCWMFFESEIDFEEKLSIFMRWINNFSPRKLYLSKFTNIITTKELINIIKNNL